MRMLAVSLAMLVVVSTGPSIAEMYGEEYQSCSRGSTIDIVECLGARTKAWDAELTAEFNAVATRVDPRQRDSLRTAQRLWVQYRAENCRFYGSREGSMRQIEAAECLRSMTKARADELKLLGTSAGSN